MFTVPLPDNYPYVLLTVVALAIQCTFIPPLLVIPARKRVFNRDYMTGFEGEHRDAFLGETPLPDLGFPDTGNGYFSKKISYKEWYEFNNAQRAHMNFVE